MGAGCGDGDCFSDVLVRVCVEFFDGDMCAVRGLDASGDQDDGDEDEQYLFCFHLILFLHYLLSVTCELILYIYHYIRFCNILFHRGVK